jgi:DNA replication protein DnaC
MNHKLIAVKAIASGDNETAIKMSGLMKVSEIKKTEICVTHGEYESRNIFNSLWSQCQECAKISKDRKEKEENDRESALRLQRWQNRIGEAGIPERFSDRTLESYSASTEGQKLALTFAKEFADNFDVVLKTGRSAIFCGMPGTGKTHLSVGIGLAVMAARNRVLFITVQKMMRKIKESWGQDAEFNESQVIASMVDPELLIIDEVGVQFGSEFEKNIMFEILNSRYENRLPTLILSNLPADKIKAFLGERVFDRLREDGGKCIAFDWESHRGKK